VANGLAAAERRRGAFDKVMAAGATKQAKPKVELSLKLPFQCTSTGHSSPAMRKM
jgi:hypothetical protein